MKPLFAALLWSFTILLTNPVFAHDIGVTQLGLIQTAPTGYRLSGEFGPAAAYMHPSPMLPSKCQYEGDPQGTQNPMQRVWVVRCTKPLDAADSIVLTWRRDGALITAKWTDQQSVTRLFPSESGTITVHLDELLAGSGSLLDASQRYLVLGFEHMLSGYDHILFVLALVFLVSGPWRLIKTITAFTIAHSITLGLATLGLVSVPSKPVEAAIALSIVFVCAEIIYAQRGLKGVTFRNPWIVAFAFGLLHGLGFAGALSEIGLPPNEVPIALLFFNIGVEIGQLSLIFAFLALVALAKRLNLPQPIQLRTIVMYSVGATAMFWTFERVGSIFG